ncbi:hypothetical protein FH972_025104 [Carpinus fangiana]|uniref:SAM-dependent MTase RsmB/NOP-type domain-containing protein n=1 Tax=Carpinus fangiana TaxID=176857 RepID=A0A5N6L0A2_9ROSI|nr:hypothetical protein FH972_025104 [Carpinus fangiana]
MSLYYEAAQFIDGSPQSSTLKSRIYGAKDLRGSAAQIHGLCIEATRWSPVLAEVIEKAGVLVTERKLTPALALLLTHDLLVGKRISARKDHVLCLAINRHKARLGAEFTRARLRSGHPTVDAWRLALVEENGPRGEKSSHPRWVRVNTLLSDQDAECKQDGGAFYGWQEVSSLQDLFTPTAESTTSKKYFIDSHVPSLLATPPGSESLLTKTPAYRQGRIILQDKASCFPAYLLFSTPFDYLPNDSLDGTAPRTDKQGDIIDACAAPGNKTTHLAALVMAAHNTQSSDQANDMRRPKITAVEKDKTRAATLARMVATAGADKDGLVTCLQGQDFSRLNPDDSKWKHVTALLLDPSCSGSGIVGRDQGDDEGTGDGTMGFFAVGFVRDGGGGEGGALEEMRELEDVAADESDDEFEGFSDG